MYSFFLLQVIRIKNRLNIVPKTGHIEDIMSEMKIGGINQRELEKIGSTQGRGDAAAFTQNLLSQLELGQEELDLINNDQMDKVAGSAGSPSRIDLSGLSPEDAMRRSININYV